MNDAINEKVWLELHDLYENAPCGYHGVGSERSILRMNQTELTWLGFTQQELVGKRRFAELVSARFHSRYERALEALIVGRKIANIEFDTELTRKGGSTKPRHWRAGI